MCPAVLLPFAEPLLPLQSKLGDYDDKAGGVV